MEDYQETIRRSKIAWEKWAEVLTYFTPVIVVKAITKVPAPRRGEVVRQISSAVRDKIQPLSKLVNILSCCSSLCYPNSFHLKLVKSSLKGRERFKSILICVIMLLACLV